MHRITIDLARCRMPCLVCEEIAPGLRATIVKKGNPLSVGKWAWLENGNRLTILANSCPMACIEVRGFCNAQ